VRFLGRRWYLAFAVILTCAVRKGLTDFRVKSVVAKIKVPRQTIERWCTWWQEDFATSAFFKVERGRFNPLQIEAAILPTCLLSCFEGADLSSQLLGLLRFLAPLRN